LLRDSLLLFSFLMRLGIRKWVAFLGSLFFAFSLSFWQMAVVAEVYTLHTLIMMRFSCSYCSGIVPVRALILARRLDFGLGMANHHHGVVHDPWRSNLGDIQPAVFRVAFG
jgi:hypothetical protein